MPKTKGLAHFFSPKATNMSAAEAAPRVVEDEATEEEAAGVGGGEARGQVNALVEKCLPHTHPKYP